MPLYEFRCSDCRKKFQIVESVKDYSTKKPKCPKCKSTRVERVWSRVYAITSKKS